MKHYLYSHRFQKTSLSSLKEVTPPRKNLEFVQIVDTEIFGSPGSRNIVITVLYRET